MRADMGPTGWLASGLGLGIGIGIGRGRLVTATTADLAHRIMRPDDTRAALSLVRGRVDDHPTEALHEVIDLVCHVRSKGLGGNCANKKKQCGYWNGDQSEQPARFRFVRF